MEAKIIRNIKYKKMSGFTLLEVIVVVVILGIIAAWAAPRLFQRADASRVTTARLQIATIETALKLFQIDNGFYPSTKQGLIALIIPPETGFIPENYRLGGYFSKKYIPQDPWGNAYIYISPGAMSYYEIISYGADGKPGGAGYAADITNLD
ncbi:MAG: type II secretion system major pseudopilin GspG [Nitrospira sp.]|nr:type II secretion system major pseudopilin GspG [Nitrospira sp.]